LQRKTGDGVKIMGFKEREERNEKKSGDSGKPFHV
jgi:hypothetical protein